MPIQHTKTSPDRMSFAVTDAERILIGQCVARAVGICKEMKLKVSDLYVLDLKMDITATHANGNKLDLQKLLAFDNLNFMHDIAGITRHIDRNNGKLLHSFSPRSTMQEG